MADYNNITPDSNFWQNAQAGLPGAAGNFAQFFSNLFGGNTNPADAANPYLQQVPGAVSPYYQPYIDRGNTAQNNAMGQYNQAVNDPGSLYNKISSGYKQSPGYQFRLNQALGGSNSAAAAGGMLGTPQNRQQDMGVAEGLANQDYESYLNHVMSLYGAGLGGQQHIGDLGAQASTGMANSYANSLLNQANNAFYGQQSQNAADSSGLGGLFGGIGSVLSWLL